MSVKLIAEYDPDRADMKPWSAQSLAEDDVLEFWLTLDKADITRSLIECVMARDLPWPPNGLVMKIGKRKWVRFTGEPLNPLKNELR